MAWLGGETPERGVVVEVDGDRIAAVTPGAEARPEDAIRLDGITLPGLANAHSHAFHRALRGRTHRGPGSFWTWREQMYALAERLDPDSYRALARATFAEMALAGFTAVGEFHYLHHGPGGRRYEDPNEMGRALIGAARDAGLRIGLINACYLRPGFERGADWHPVQRRFADANAEAWADRVDLLAAALEGDVGVRVGAAIHSVRAVGRGPAVAVAAWARDRSAPLHAHVSEQPAENDACFAATGLTPTELLADAGALGRSFTAVHATHLSDSDIAFLGEHGVTCCLCPTTERDLADGIGPAHGLVTAGARVAVGTDSHAMIDAFEEARAIELDERLASGERGRHRPVDLLAAGTHHGQASIGFPKAGRIAPGAIADLVTVSLDCARLAGADAENALAMLVFAGLAADVRSVIAAGTQIVDDGAHLSIDVAAELDAAIGAIAENPQ